MFAIFLVQLCSFVPVPLNEYYEYWIKLWLHARVTFQCNSCCWKNLGRMVSILHNKKLMYACNLRTMTGMLICRQLIATFAVTFVVTISVDASSSAHWITKWRNCITFIDIYRNCKVVRMSKCYMIAENTGSNHSLLPYFNSKLVFHAPMCSIFMLPSQEWASSAAL